LFCLRSGYFVVAAVAVVAAAAVAVVAAAAVLLGVLFILQNLVDFYYSRNERCQYEAIDYENNNWFMITVKF